MIGFSFLPARWQSTEHASARPTWISRKVTPGLLALSRRACVHPIYTIVSVAILASTTYLGLLESSLFERHPVESSVGRIDLNNLLAGSKTLYTGHETSWKWAIEETGRCHDADEHFALVTLVFPDSISSSPSTAPQPNNVPASSNFSTKVLPCSTNPLSPISQDSTIAYSLPYPKVASFLAESKEIPVSAEISESRYTDDGADLEEKKWIMKAVKNPGSGTGGLRGWAENAWTDFVDLLKNAETLDIIIMILGYISMHLTFVSLFLSMRRLGSNFWLATTVLFSSIFAFLFGLIVTMRLGVALNVVLLSEGLPFLVVTVGFEKPIVLTKAVLAASLDRKRPETAEHGKSHSTQPPSIQYAVQAAVKERGFEIVRDYLLEILILIAGAASPVQGGLRPFCFLAAWILFFDCLLLFSFYTAILTVKLEINRIKRHVALRKALEDDGVSRRVAENVASSNDWPKLNLTEEEDGAVTQSKEIPFFGRKIRDSSVPKFKVLMVTGFVLINALNLLTIPFRSSPSPLLSGLSSVVSQPPMDPFKVAGSGLDTLLANAKKHQQSTIVTVLAPVKYELEYPSIHYAPRDEGAAMFDGEYTQQVFDGMGGRMVEGLLKSFEDPRLSKWIIVALVMSLVLNGYLFNAARWTIPGSAAADQQPTGIEVMDRPTPENENRQLANGHPQALAPDGLRLEIEHKAESETNGDVMGPPGEPRTLEECEALLKEKRARELLDEELIDLSQRGKIPRHALEKTIGDMTRAVKVRRALVARTHATRETSALLEHSNLPYRHFDYERVLGACCENVIGYMPLPVGVAGPIMIDGRNYFLPMATTEGVLVASTSRGCKAINAGGGAVTVLTGDGMTRGPCVGFKTVARAGAAKIWLDSEDGQRTMRNAFNSTSRFARLQQMKTAMAGSYLYIRFKTTTGDAMGMNMISKGVEHALNVMSTEAGFDDMSIISVSGNYCTDKKPAAINWIDGRGKSVVAEAIIPAHVVESVLKSDVDSLIELNTSKNFIGSAMAGSIGGFNAHAANIVTALFLATGQDPAQNVESSNCITVMKKLNGALQISVSMPSIEVGTIGGGTILEPQAAMLDLLGVRGPHPTNSGDNARQLARIIAAGVLAGELSLCSALAEGHLVRAHMSHNRSAATSRAATPAPSQQGSPKRAALAMSRAGR